MSTPVRLTLPCVPKVLSVKDRTVRYVASSQALDCYREVVRAAGWRFDRFKNNAPFVDSHNYGSVGFLLGKVIGCQVQGDQLLEDTQYIPEGASALADFAWKMSEAGFLTAVSVGFMPLKIRSRWRDEKDFAAACLELGLTTDVAAQCSVIHWEQDQTELSAVLIGANPEAVAKAHKAGAVTSEDFAKLGIGDTDLSFIHEASDGFKAATPLVKRALCEEMRSLFSRTLSMSSNSASGNPPANMSSRAAAAGNEKREAQKAELLRELRAFSTGINRCASSVTQSGQ